MNGCPTIGHLKPSRGPSICQYSPAMTLILGAVWRGRAIHASDRMLSVRNVGEFDAHSNKTVVVCGSDCRIVLGYSGLAFLNGKPTDEFIAEAITGLSDLSGGGSLMGWSDRGLHYRAIRDRIERAIANAYTRLPRKTAEEYTTRVLAVGWQRKTRFPKGLWPKWTWQHKPVVFLIEVNQNGARSIEVLTGLTRRLREIGKEIGYFAHAIGTSVHSLRVQTNQRLASYTSLPSATAEGIMEILMDEIQETALEHPESVGMDAMGVIVDDIKGNSVTTHFRLAEEAKHAELRQRAIDAMGPGGTDISPDVAGVPTPFVITPSHTIYLPSFSSTGPWMNESGFEYRIEGWPNGEQQPGSFFTGQPRKGPDGQWQAWTPP